MHVAYVCADPGVPVFGRKGCSIHVQEILRALRARGDRITLVCANRGGEPPADLADLVIRDLPRLPDQREPGFPEAVEALAATTERELQALGAVELIYERHSLWSHRAMERARALGIPNCLEVNAPLIEEQQRFRSLLHPQLAHHCVERAYRAAGTVIAVSSQVAASIHERCPQVSRVHVVHNGVAVDRFPPAEVRRGGDGLQIGFCGSLRPWHGVEDLVEAFALHSARQPYSRLTIIGDGPMRPAIEQRIEALALGGCVSMTGAVSPEDIPGLLAALEVGVAPYPDLPDLYFSPLKLFEYLAAGLCAVAPRVGDIPWLLASDQTGVLYDAGDIEGLSRVFDQLCEQPALRSRIAAEGRCQAREQHSWSRVLERILSHVQASEAGRR